MKRIWHYVYKLTEDITGHFYIGMRTSYSEPTDDIDYRGSGMWAKAARRAGILLDKEIVQICRSRHAASALETRLIVQSSLNPLCMNLDCVKLVKRTMAYTPFSSWQRDLVMRTVEDHTVETSWPRTKRIILEEQAREASR